MTENLPAKTNGGAVATTGVLDRLLDSVAPEYGRIVRFDKNAQYVCADNGDTIADSVVLIALADQLTMSWLRFNGPGTPPDRVSVKPFEGGELPPRDSLGDIDPAKWELGLNGKPSDPWVNQMAVALQHPDTGELYTFQTSSITGKRAVGNLIRAFTRMEKSGEGSYPLVQLKVGSFQHADSRVGLVKVPVLAIVGKTPKAGATKADGNIAADMNDTIPF